MASPASIPRGPKIAPQWSHDTYIPVLNPVAFEAMRCPTPAVPKSCPDRTTKDYPFTIKPHPSLSPASWETREIPPPRQARVIEPRPNLNYPFPILTHPSLNVATWEGSAVRPQRAHYTPPTITDGPILISASVASPIASWAHIQPVVAPIVRRWVRPIVDEPMTYAAANASLAWARWNSEQSPRSILSARRAAVRLTDEPFIASASGIAIPVLIRQYRGRWS